MIHLYKLLRVGARKEKGNFYDCGVFSVCGTFKMPDKDKDITLVIFKTKDQKENYSNNASFCSSPTLQTPSCLSF